MTFGKVRIYGSFALLWAVLLYLDAGRLLAPVWGCALLHELGHWIPLRLLGGRVESWELSAGGIGMNIAPDGRLSYPAEMLCTLAGPLASVLGALFFMGFDDIIAWSGICLVQGLFNLLPAAGLDGGRLILLALRWAGRTDADLILRRLTLVTSLAITVAGAYIFVYSGYNLTLLLLGVYFALSVFGRMDND